MISLKYPGKLFIMGEYSIMEPGSKAVIAAMDRFMHAEITKSDSMSINTAFGSLDSLTNLSLEGPLRFVSAALRCVHRYIGHSDINYTLNLRSELEDHSKKKYGLGSSGVVVVATIAAVLKLYEIPFTRMDLFKLSVIAQRNLNELSSGGDIAAAIYSGIVYYERYDYRWIQDKSLEELMKTAWPKLRIENLNEAPVRFDVIWTASENKTTPYLRTFLDLKNSDLKTFDTLIESADSYVDNFVESWTNGNIHGIDQAITNYRMWMLEVQINTGLNIETSRLTEIIELAHNHNFSAKISGSGGGDCAIVMNVQENVENRVKMHKELEKRGILLLDIEVYYDKYSIKA